MKKFLIVLIAFNLASSLSAQALESARNAPVFSTTGKKIGRIDRLVIGSNGAISAVRVIYNGKFITIPAATLKNRDKGLTTTLSSADLGKL